MDIHKKQTKAVWAARSVSDLATENQQQKQRIQLRDHQPGATRPKDSRAQGVESMATGGLWSGGSKNELPPVALIGGGQGWRNQAA